jgi:mRNA-degrading endonuclease RelE of RelBE toxin-antitoxin system
VKLTVSPGAVTDLAGLPARDRRLLFERVEAFAAEPFAIQPAARPLRGREDCVRIRQGDWRAVCRIDRSTDTVTLERIEQRREIPMSETPDGTVILSRAEYEALIERIEDAEDNAFLDAIEARERASARKTRAWTTCRPSSFAGSSTATIRCGSGARIAA